MRSRSPSPELGGVGTRFDCVTRIGPFRTTDRMTVTEWTPDWAMGIEHRGAVTGPRPVHARQRPRGRTRFTWTEELTFPWWMGGAVGASLLNRSCAVWRRNLAEH